MGIWDRLKQGLDRLTEELVVDGDVRTKLDAARVALADARLDDAVTALQQATRDDPDYAPAWQLLGLTQLRLRRAEQAIAALERADALNPDDFATIIALAQAQRALGNEGQALRYAKQALRGRVDERQLARVFGLLGEVYLERDEIDRAVRELRKAVAASGGADREFLGLLGRAQFREGSLSLARESLQRAAASTPAEPEVLALLCETLLALGVVDEARAAAQRLLDESGQGRTLLARCLLEANEPTEARQHLLRALASGDAENPEPERATDYGRPMVHRLLAQTHLAVDEPGEALRQLRVARELTHPPSADLLRQLLDLEIETDGPTDALAADAEALELLRQDDPLALAARAIATRQDAQAATALLARSLATADNYPARLGLGLVLLESHAPRDAVAALRAALRLRPDGKRARALLVRAYRELSGLEQASPAAALYPSLRRAQQLLVARPAYDDLAEGVGRVSRDFDRPLLLAVMGEFNSGKSTFVNALIGEEIAPMGVTPTTATINLLKYGERRAVRVVWTDDREQLLEWDQLGPFLEQLDAGKARTVRVVELLYPAEELLRVNVVDTPGLNSMIPEHEETAREFIQQADAVVWLFCADQAGKQTEQEALELIQKQRLKTVAVLNKVDRLRPAELEPVLAHLRTGFAPLVEALIPVSARAALAARVEGNAQMLDESGFTELRALLEQRVFSRSRRIKREVGTRKLDDLLAEAQRRAERDLVPLEAALGRLQSLSDELVSSRQADPRVRERPLLRRAVDDLYRKAADEVLDFVRPRRWVFGEHRASRADRDFLLELLQQGFEQVGRRSHERIAQALSEQLAQLGQEMSALCASGPLAALSTAPADLDRVASQQLALLRQQVYARHQAFVRGFLRGGRVDHFFEQQLGELKLEAGAIQQALALRAPDLAAELLAPLYDWHHEATAALVQQLAALRQEAAMLALELDAGLLGPLAEIRQRLQASGS